MDEGSRGFAKEMVAAFGEDRFYHAFMRLGNYREAKAFYEALGGTDWNSRAQEMKLKFAMASLAMGSAEIDEEQAKEILCRTAYTLAKHHKEFAMRRPEMPPHIHARMVLGEQNEWTRKYVEVLKEE